MMYAYSLSSISLFLLLFAFAYENSVIRLSVRRLSPAGWIKSHQHRADRRANEGLQLITSSRPQTILQSAYRSEIDTLAMASMTTSGSSGLLNEREVVRRTGIEAISQFLNVHTSFAVLRASGKVVVFDTRIPIQLAFYALVEHGEYICRPEWRRRGGWYTEKRDRVAVKQRASPQDMSVFEYEYYFFGIRKYALI